CLPTDIYFSELKKNEYLISTFHGHYELYEKDIYPGSIENLYTKVLKKLDHVVYTTEKHLNTLRRFNFPPDKTTKIYYGLDLKFQPNELNSFHQGDILKICIASRAIAGKGWEELIKAVINLNGRLVDCLS